jgi:hypothetical protein
MANSAPPGQWQPSPNYRGRLSSTSEGISVGRPIPCETGLEPLSWIAASHPRFHAASGAGIGSCTRTEGHRRNRWARYIGILLDHVAPNLGPCKFEYPGCYPEFASSRHRSCIHSPFKGLPVTQNWRGLTCTSSIREHRQVLNVLLLTESPDDAPNAILRGVKQPVRSAGVKHRFRYNAVVN